MSSRRHIESLVLPKRPTEGGRQARGPEQRKQAGEEGVVVAMAAAGGVWQAVGSRRCDRSGQGKEGAVADDGKQHRRTMQALKKI